MLGMKPPLAARHDLADRVLRDREVHDDAIVRRDLRHDVEAQHRLLERHRRRAARRRLLIRNLRTLEDARLALVRRHDARRRHHAAVAFGLQRRQLEVDEVVVAEDRQGDRAGRARDRQVHVVPRGERRHRDGQCRAAGDCRSSASRRMLSAPSAAARHADEAVTAIVVRPPSRRSGRRARGCSRR